MAGSKAGFTLFLSFFFFFKGGSCLRHWQVKLRMADASRAASTRTLLAKDGKPRWLFNGSVAYLKLAMTDQSFRISMQACTCVFGAIII